MKNQTIKNQLTRSIFFAVVLAAVFFAANLNLVQASNNDGCDRQCQRDLASAKAATAKYHNVDKAIADGFISTFQCVEVPQLGAMGIHYINIQRILNPNVDPAEPEILLYLPQESGHLRLVGLEYVVPKFLASTPPTLFGQVYEDDAARNQWALHVWAWRNNPSGLFAPFNPKLSCPNS